MKKTIFKSALLAVMGVGLAAGNAMADLTFDDGGVGLTAELNAITVAIPIGEANANPSGNTSVNVLADALSDQNDSYWSINGTGLNASVLAFTFIGTPSDYTFGVFDYANKDTTVDLFWRERWHPNRKCNED